MTAPGKIQRLQSARPAEEDLELADFERPFIIDLSQLANADEAARTELYARVQELRRILTLNPLWGFMPHLGEQGFKIKHGIPLDGTESRGQVEFLELLAMGVFIGAVVASNRFGKTEINVIEAAVQTLPWEFIPPWLAPYKILDPEKRDVRMRFVGPDKDHWRDQTMVPKMRRLLPPAALLGGSFDSAWKHREGKLTFKDGSWWDFLTHDMDQGAFASVDIDSFRLDEELTGEAGREKWDESIRGLVDRAGYIRITLTPVEGIGWLHEELADQETDEPRKDADAWVVTGSIDHNPHLSKTGRETVKRAWAKRGASVYQARAHGLWVHREGLIFPEFVREPERAPGTGEGGHLRADRPLAHPTEPSPRDPKTGDWLVPVFEAIDPGINVDHPFAFTVAFLNTGATDVFGMDDVLELFYAYKEPNLTVNQQASIVHDARTRFGYRPAFTVIDPSARSRNQESGKQLIELWRQEGIFPVIGQNSRPLTYEAMHMRLTGSVAPGAPADPSTSRYRVWASVDALFGHEMSRYRWRKPTQRTESVPAPEPIKRNDDLIDTQRYMVVRIPVWRGGGRMVEEDLPEVITHPQRQALKAHLASLRRGRGRNPGKVGGVFPGR